VFQHESSGGKNLIGQPTRYGTALGGMQMLPGTAREMSGRLGLPFDQARLTATDASARAYQRQLGDAYLQQGLHATNDLRSGLMYYHGGPNQRLWGPKTHAYADNILGKLGWGTN
jgi:soluble lytic murein transglycosylase-like protein